MSIKKEHEKAFLSAAKYISHEKIIIPVNPAMDIMLGGGIPSGSFVVCSGKQKLGKTTAMLHFAAKAQKLGFKIYYFNIEGRLKKRDIEGISGLDVSEDKFQIIASTQGNILHAEDYLDIAVTLNETEQNIIIILDSVSQLCSSSRFEANVGDRFRDDVPLMLGSLTKRVSNVLPVNNNIIICVTHIVANQGNGHSQWMEASGQKIQYQGDVKLKATYKEDYKDGENIIGQIVHWACDFSALGPPGRTCSTLLRYGSGLDDQYDIAQLGVDLSIIKKGGSWYTLPNEQKCQGMEKTVRYLKENPDVYNEVYKTVKSML